jgi:hypothetical protein
MPTNNSSTHKKLTSTGWSSLAPGRHERTVMKKKCGSKCFLGPIGESCFPICTKGTCKINDKGVYAAYVRAREYASAKIKKCTKRWPCHKKTKKTKTQKNRGHHRHSKKLYGKIASKAKKILIKHGFEENLA